MRKANKKSERPSQKNQSRTEEMRELFQSDMSERKQKRSIHGARKKKFKRSLKASHGMNKFLVFYVVLIVLCMWIIFNYQYQDLAGSFGELN